MYVTLLPLPLSANSLRPQENISAKIGLILSFSLILIWGARLPVVRSPSCFSPNFTLSFCLLVSMASAEKSTNAVAGYGASAGHGARYAMVPYECRISYSILFSAASHSLFLCPDSHPAPHPPRFASAASRANTPSRAAAPRKSSRMEGRCSASGMHITFIMPMPCCLQSNAELTDLRVFSL